jgi:hypothetical protein
VACLKHNHGRWKHLAIFAAVIPNGERICFSFFHLVTPAHPVIPPARKMLRDLPRASRKPALGSLCVEIFFFLFRLK